jgi:Xaa-Pro dipeptidase
MSDSHIQQIQQALDERGLDGWLFYDHHHRDPIAYRVLGLDLNTMATRRWFYLLPAEGEPAKLVHRIESSQLDALPGSKRLYSSWRELGAQLQEMLRPCRRVAMQYSPNNLIPYIGLVDAGTVEMVRSFGIEVVSSADLVQIFEACWSDAALGSHLEAGQAVDEIVQAAFAAIGRRVPTDEYSIQQFILEKFDASGLITDEPPIVAVNQNSGNPHYEPRAGRSAPIRAGDFVLLDVWARKNRPGSVYYDVTWVGFVGPAPPEKIREIFEIVRQARDTGVAFVADAVRAGRSLRGWEVDDAVRGFIRGKGYADYFPHRTGHSIGESVHGNGANMDNLETKDEREIIPRTCFSIEPGIYLPEFGVRSEVNVYVGEREARVTGAVQRDIVRIASG